MVTHSTMQSIQIILCYMEDPTTNHSTADRVTILVNGVRMERGESCADFCLVTKCVKGRPSLRSRATWIYPVSDMYVPPGVTARRTRAFISCMCSIIICKYQRGIPFRIYEGMNDHGSPCVGTLRTSTDQLQMSQEPRRTFQDKRSRVHRGAVLFPVLRRTATGCA